MELDTVFISPGDHWEPVIPSEARDLLLSFYKPTQRPAGESRLIR